MGYHRAGFEVVGVDIRPQKRFPFEFVQADALEFCREHGHEFDAIHASPPCQQFSTAKRLNPKCNHPDLIAETRKALQATGKPWIIENVPGAPLHFPVTLCGLALGTNVKRHRLFESNKFLFGTTCPAGHKGNWITVFGHDGTIHMERKRWVTVFCGGAPRVPDKRRRATLEQRKEAMGINWMTRDELSLAIPPAYTELIGKQLRRAIDAQQG